MLSKPLGNKLAKPLAKNLPWGSAPSVDPWGGLPLPDDATLGIWLDANKGTYTNSYGGLDLIEGPAFGERLTRWEGYPIGVYATSVSDSKSPSIERIDTGILSEIYFDRVDDEMQYFGIDPEFFSKYDYIYSMCGINIADTNSSSFTIFSFSITVPDTKTIFIWSLINSLTIKRSNTAIQQGTTTNSIVVSSAYNIGSYTLLSQEIDFPSGTHMLRASKGSVFNPIQLSLTSLPGGTLKPTTTSFTTTKLGGTASRPTSVVSQICLFGSNRKLTTSELQIIEEFLFNKSLT